MTKQTNDMRYCGRGLPKQPISAGRFLVHNQVIPEAALGMSGFRAWTQGNRKGLVRCYCDFGRCKNAELHKHYRVQFGETPKDRQAERASWAAIAEFLKKPHRRRDGEEIWEAHHRIRRGASRAGGRAYAKVMRAKS
jgi:hypothetical protein